MADASWRSRLQDAVNKSGKSLRAISLAAGCSHGYLHGILKEGKEPTIDRLKQICAEIGVGVTYVMLGNDLTEIDEELVFLLSHLRPEKKRLLLGLAREFAADSDQTSSVPPAAVPPSVKG